MPSRTLVAKELSEIFKILAHPAEQLDLAGTRVSQHLSLMRAHRLVDERREGRRHVYRLLQPEIAEWIIEGLDFVEGRMTGVDKSAIDSARKLWKAQQN